EGPLYEGRDHVPPVRTERQRLVHARRPQQPRLTIAELGELARRIELEQRLVVRVLEQIRVRRRARRLLPGTTDDRAVRNAVAGRLGASGRRNQKGDDR